jgi:AraC-like DNA-binding protein
VYFEQAPPPPLARLVECIWWIESATPLERYAVMPDGCLDIVFTGDAGLRAMGAMTATRHFDLAASARSAGVRFHPGMAGRVLGIPPSELTDNSVPLEDILGPEARQTAARIPETESIAELIELLLTQIHPPDTRLNPVQRAIEAITAAHGSVDLDRIASHANLSPRQFRRRCLEESGLTPRLLCRVLRFRHARDLAARPDRHWADIAAAAGYYDQAHLIRDFREFSGATPMAVFSNTASPLRA